MLIGIQDEILRLAQLGLLNLLLKDQTTGHNIRWATDAYVQIGHAYERNAEITADVITGEHSGVIRNRARKELELQSGRTKSHAEVFTPIWVCNRMIDELLADISTTCSECGKANPFIYSRCLEITCGEAPFLVQRYDVLTGEIIPIEQRKGILDRKLQCAYSLKKDNIINENCEILKIIICAFQSVYGYELQGDNLLIARLNLYMTFEEYLQYICERKPTYEESLKMIEIITWNLWQMDGLTGHTPCGESAVSSQLSLFDFMEISDKPQETPKPCKVRFYIRPQKFKTLTIQQIAEQGGQSMKFNYIIGNPPYQEETADTSDMPIYNSFMDAAYKVADKVELITPARFLFNAGKTPENWNEKMLNDEHLKVLKYTQKSSDIFANTDIKGGIAITYRDANKYFGAIGAYSQFSELNSIRNKVISKPDFSSLSEWVYAPESYKFSEALHAENPEIRFKGENVGILSKGHDYDVVTNIFSKLPNIFIDEKTTDNENWLGFVGLIGNKRFTKYIKRKYIRPHENLDKYKVILPKSNGSGAIGEVLSTPVIGTPVIGHTQSFISIGALETEREAENLLKYIKSKFARTMLGILKITQDNKKKTWKYVPLQDFTSKSDIDWTKSIPDIDQQLYKKYGLDKSEIDFIESHVKAMA